MEHRLAVGPTAVGTTAAAAAAAAAASASLLREKKDFVAFCHQRVKRVQDDAMRREEQCTIVHEPNDRWTSKVWLAGWLDPSTSDQVWDTC